MTAEGILAKLRALPNMVACEVPQECDLRRVFDVEAQSETLSGMPLENRALRDVQAKKHFILAVFNGDFEPTASISVQMENAAGMVVGRQIPIEDRPKYEGRGDLVWLSDDFWIDPNALGGEVKMVLIAQPLTVIGPQDGANAPIAMYPAVPGDKLIREILGVPEDPAMATAVIGYD